MIKHHTKLAPHMRHLLLILLTSIGGLSPCQATTYYISLSGSNTNSGLSSATAWRTLTYAASNASPVAAGDTVHVAAGDYGDEEVEFEKSGSAGLPIVFLGYQTAPGDAPPLLVDQPDPYLDFDPSLMPTYDGVDRASGIGFDLQDEQYLVIRNFQIRNYAYGVLLGSGSQADAGHHVLYNINVRSIGNVNGGYSGMAIRLGSMGTDFANHNTLTNCLVVNAAAEGMSINGDHNQLTGCMVLCNDVVTSNAATDYYIFVCGSFNTVDDCTIEREPGLAHNGHGIGVKSNAEQVVDDGLPLPVIAPQYNLFRNCTAYNVGESFYVRHRLVEHNTFQHCTAYGTHTGANGSGSGEGNAMVVRDGASNNVFDGCVAENCLSGFNFLDTVEDGDTGVNPPGHPGNDNTFSNCIIRNCYIGVRFNDYSIPSDAGDNTIANCTFYKTRYMFQAGRACANMNYINNIFHGCLPATPGGAFKVGAFSSDIQANAGNTYFSHCDFINIQGGMPGGFVAATINGLSADPQFVDPLNGDFHLQPASPCVDAGTALAEVDHDSIPRPQGSGTDIGAFEYSGPLVVIAHDATTGSPVIDVYPNPANGCFTLALFGFDPGTELHVAILDVNGRQHLSKSLTGASPGMLIPVEPVASLMPGIYLVTVTQGGDRMERRLIVQ